MDDDAEATLVIDWNRVAADVNYRETIVLAAEAQAIVDKERADEVLCVLRLAEAQRGHEAMLKMHQCGGQQWLSPAYVTECKFLTADEEEGHRSRRTT